MSEEAVYTPDQMMAIGTALQSHCVDLDTNEIFPDAIVAIKEAINANGNKGVVGRNIMTVIAGFQVKRKTKDGLYRALLDIHDQRKSTGKVPKVAKKRAKKPTKDELRIAEYEQVLSFKFERFDELPAEHELMRFRNAGYYPVLPHKLYRDSGRGGKFMQYGLKNKAVDADTFYAEVERELGEEVPAKDINKFRKAFEEKHQAHGWRIGDGSSGYGIYPIPYAENPAYKEPEETE